jgi:RNA polymerase sigma-70 factor (ECF subfamily)
VSLELLYEAPNVATDYPSLVNAYLEGDRKAGDALALAVRNSLLRRIRRFSASSAVAEELAQDCMLQIFARLGEFSPDKGAFEAWVGGFALNALRSNRRREIRARVTTIPVDDVAELSYDIADYEDERDLLSKAIGTLEMLDQELVHMRYSLGMSSDEIATACGLNSPQVRKRLSRAVERLRRHPAVGQLLQ